MSTNPNTFIMEKGVLSEVSMSTLGVNHLEVFACNCKIELGVIWVWLRGVRY